MRSNSLVGTLPNQWNVATLGEACRLGGGDVQTGPFGSQLHASDYVAVGVPSIMPQNIGDNRINTQDIARITEADAKRLAKYLVRCGDIVYSRRGDVERRSLIRQHEDGWLCGTGCLRVRVGKGFLDPAYLSYYLGHQEIRAWIVRHAVGATMPNLNTGILSALPIVVPPLDEQRAIAAILGSLDDKIELNAKMNRTLEAMARAIFKSWFVDFDPVRAKMEGRKPFGMDDATVALFPDSFEDSELGPIPKGWRLQPLWDIANFVNGAAYRDFHFTTESGALPIVKIAEIKNGISSQTKFTRTELASKYRIKDGDILFSWSGNPDTSIDTFVWTGGPGWLNQHIYRVSLKSPVDRNFIYYQLKMLRPVFAEIARDKQTTGLGHVTAQDMKRLLVPECPLTVRTAFNDRVGPLFDKRYANLLLTKNLTRMRDTLLPKLVSGEIRVNDAEKIVEGRGWYE